MIGGGRLPTMGGPTVGLRRIPLVPMWNRRTAAPVVFSQANHGIYLGLLHIEQADLDVNFKQVAFVPVVLPTDYATGAMTLYWQALSNAAGGNYTWDLSVIEAAAGIYVGLLGVMGTPWPAAVGANQLQVHSQGLFAVPTPGSVLWVEIGMNSNDVGDTNAGTRCLYGAWLEYLANV